MAYQKREESTDCPRCGKSSSYAKCPHCHYAKWYNPARNTHNKLCKCKKCLVKKETVKKSRAPRVRGK